MSKQPEEITTEVAQAMEWQIDHTKKQIRSLERAANRVDDSEDLKVKGTLLKTYAKQVNARDGIVTLPDYRTDKQLTIALDTTKSVMENAEMYFHQYRKDKRGLETVQNNLSKTRQILEQEQQRQSQFDTTDEAQTAKIRKELIAEGAIKERVLHSSKAPEPAHPRRFYTSDHVLVEVGKNSAQNDHLTLTSNKDFYWMHVSELAGSHVVIHSVEPSEQCLYEAANLTAYYSKGRGLKQVPVDVLKVRQLFKPKGAKSGLVMFTGKSQTITVTPDADLARKLRDPKDLEEIN